MHATFKAIWQGLLPHPLLSVVLFLSWMALAQRLAWGSIIFALLMALIIPPLINKFVVPTPRIRWAIAIKLTAVVLWDVIVSNFKVAKRILGPTAQLHPIWIRVPLASEHEQVNSLLAMIITTTPGTVSAGIDLEKGDILVHCLTSHSPEQEIADIKARYEQPLLVIFNVLQEDASC